MRRTQRILMLAVIAAVLPMLAGCADFDPDKLDIFGLSEKKKLPGDRKPVFPEGVPGVSQGIPPEYIKGNQPPPETAQSLPAGQDNPSIPPEPEKKKTAAIDPGAEPKLKPKPKRKPKPPATASAPAQITVQPAPKGQNAAQQPNQQPAPQQDQSPWPAQQGQSSNTAPWPSSPPPGTFSR